MDGKRKKLTTIQILPEARDRLKHAARKDQTYSEFLGQLLDEHEERVEKKC